MVCYLVLTHFRQLYNGVKLSCLLVSVRFITYSFLITDLFSIQTEIEGISGTNNVTVRAGNRTYVLRVGSPTLLSIMHFGRSVWILEFISMFLLMRLLVIYLNPINLIINYISFQLNISLNVNLLYGHKRIFSTSCN